MQIHAKIACSSVNGPGNRAVIFVQGCSLRCPGCQNPKTHKFGPGERRSPFALADWVKGLEGIEGLTLSGGEPLEQLDDGLDMLVHEVKEAGLSVGLFTGYTEQELNTGNFRWSAQANTRAPKYKKAEAWRWLKTKLDWAVMGRYQQHDRSNEPMLASHNQHLVLFSDRYKLEDFAPQKVELIVLGEGGAVVTGFPVGAIGGLAGSSRQGVAGCVTEAI